MLILVSIWRSPGGLTSAPRGVVTTFCAEALHLTPGILRPARRRSPSGGRQCQNLDVARASPTRLPEAVRSQALEVQAALERSGLDHGPIGGARQMSPHGARRLTPAWLARLFRDQGEVARSEPSKDHGRPGDGSSTPPQRLLAAFDTEYTSSPQDANWSSATPGRPLPPSGGLSWSPRARPTRQPSTSSTKA